MYTEDMLMTEADLRVMAAKVAAINARRGNAKPSRAKTIQSEFARRNTSLRAWAISNGYKPATVFKVVSRWSGSRYRRPLGVLSTEIMNKLRADLGPDVIPAPTTSRQAA